MESMINLLGEIERSLIKPNSKNDNDIKNIRTIEEDVERIIPEEIRSFLINLNDLSVEDLSSVFLGYEPICLDNLVSHYFNKTESLFFMGFKLDNNFKASEGHELKIFENPHGELTENIIINDISRLIPIFDSAGSYIALFYAESDKTEIVVVTEDYGISTLAPTISDHIHNLREGILKGIYHIDEFQEIEYPTSWYQRIQAVSVEGLSKDEWNI